MADIPAGAVAHYRSMLTMEAAARTVATQAWRQVSPASIVDSWLAAIPALMRRLTAIQEEAGLAGATYSASVLADQGTYDPPMALAAPGGMTGWMISDATPGLAVPLEEAVISPAYRSLDRIGQGMGEREAMAVSGRQVARVAATAVADAARQAASVDVATRRRTGYVRMLNPPSCSRCAVLAGRMYRWNDGFLRHPGCDCVHVATTMSLDAARREGLIDDPYEYFQGLSEGEQEKLFTKAGAQAIRDGADIYQVVNARRGMAGATRVKDGRRLNLAGSDPRRRWTSEGTTGRGRWRQQGGQGRLRMTPEGIYASARTREEAQRLLRQYGYILPEGQVPGGAIRGPWAQGFGQDGRGGTRRAASAAVLDAVATGVRDPSVRATMTAAERRVADARRDWEIALSGVDPTSPGVVERRGGSRISGVMRPATPEQVAYYESTYRYMLARGGSVY